jgi:hypothetical protein
VNQLALFDLPTAPAPSRRSRSGERARNEDAHSTRAALREGMLVGLPITAAIEGERWRQYTMGLRGRIELIDGDLVEVRIDRPGHKFDGKLALAWLFGLSGNN